MSKEENYSKIKNSLSKLYSSLKFSIKKSFIRIEEHSESEENEENSGKNLSIKDLIKCISIYVNYLIEKNEKKDENNFLEEENEEKPLYKQYEELLIKAEDDIRRHIKVEQQLKIKIEDLEFELDDYRTGRIKKKVKNLLSVTESGYYSSYNYQKQKNQFKEFNTYNTNNNKNNNIDKPISVNSNNNYIISKLKKENENLKLKLSKLENESNNNNTNNEKYKQIENKMLQKKLNDGIRITKNIINNKNYISKNNYYSFANNTYTNNFYNIKENRYKSNNNNNSTINDINLNLKNYNKIILNHNPTATNSFIAHPKKNNNNKNDLIKSFQILRNDSNFKIKSNSKKIIYDKNNINKIKNSNNNKNIQFKKIQNMLGGGNNNFIEIKIKDENSNFNNINNKINNQRIYTINTFTNNEINTKKLFAKKKKFEKKKSSKLNLDMTNTNLYNTYRKKQNLNSDNNLIDSNSNLFFNSKERNTLYVPNCEFNLTWSKFPLKIITTNQKNSIQSLIRNSTNVTNDINKSLSKKILSQFKKKNKNLLTFNPNKFPNKLRKETTPPKITINRRKTTNNSKTNNSSMKNIINYINYTKPKMKDEFNLNNKEYIENNILNTCEDNKIMTKTQKNFRPGKGDIYVRKKQSSAFGVDIKSKKSENKKNDIINNNYKYNETAT